MFKTLTSVASQKLTNRLSLHPCRSFCLHPPSAGNVGVTSELILNSVPYPLLLSLLPATRLPTYGTPCNSNIRVFFTRKQHVNNAQTTCCQHVIYVLLTCCLRVKKTRIFELHGIPYLLYRALLRCVETAYGCPLMGWRSPVDQLFSSVYKQFTIVNVFKPCAWCSTCVLTGYYKTGR